LPPLLSLFYLHSALLIL